MNERLAKLEAVMPMLATKGDVADAKTSIISFAATFGGAMAAIVIGILLFAINRASPPTTAQPQPQPIVIQLPATTFQTPPAPTSAVPAK